MNTLRLTIVIVAIIVVAGVAVLAHFNVVATSISARTLLSLDTAVEEEPEPDFLQDVPSDKYGEMVRLGYRLFTQTPKYAKRYVGNELTCSNCHLDAGRRPLAAPMGPAFVAYPLWRKKDDRVNYFDDRVQQCFRFSLDGIPPALGSIELQSLTAYASFLAKGLPMGDPMVKGRGIYQIPPTGRDPNHDRGRTIYEERCAACHGENGAGTEAAPPVWGMNSYNKGAGMYKTDTLAGFVKKNMPVGDETLTDQEALDVAAFINFQFRPYDPRMGVIGLLAR